MTNKMTNRKIALYFLAVVILAGGLIFTLSAQTARADWWGDLWQKISHPTSATNGTSSSNKPSPTSLYKPAADYEQAVVTAVKKASPAVVAITVSKNVPVIEQCPANPFQDLPPELQPFFGDQFPQFYTPCQKGSKLQEVGGGSGFVVSANGMILTNKHVVSDEKASYTVFTNDGKKYDAKVLARDPVQDLAVIKIDANSLPTVELGDSNNLDLGQSAIAIGNALGEYRNTVSVGVVSGLSRTVTASGGLGEGAETIQGLIQTDAAINPGNSGGPLLNLAGQVIGINTAVATNAQNIGFAIPINRAKKDVQSVGSKGVIEAAYLGVRYLMITSDLAKEQNLKVEYGALVRGTSEGPAVAKDSPAEKAGVQAEDIIVEFNGQKVDQDHALGSMISELSVGQSVSFKVNRGGKEISMNATLAKRPTGK